MLQDSIPLIEVEHLRQVVLDGVGALGDRVEDDVAGEPDSNLLEDECTLRDHEDRCITHFIHRPLSMALLFISVLTNHSDLGVLALNV